MERYRSGRNGVDSKSICPVNSGARGFESHPLRHFLLGLHTPLPVLLRFLKSCSCFHAERCPSWPKERDWKSRVLLTGGTEGSNPSLSAIFFNPDMIYSLLNLIPSIKEPESRGNRVRRVCNPSIRKEPANRSCSLFWSGPYRLTKIFFLEFVVDMPLLLSSGKNVLRGTCQEMASTEI